MTAPAKRVAHKRSPDRMIGTAKKDVTSGAQNGSGSKQATQVAFEVWVNSLCKSNQINHIISVTFANSYNIGHANKHQTNKLTN